MNSDCKPDSQGLCHGEEINNFHQLLGGVMDDLPLENLTLSVSIYHRVFSPTAMCNFSQLADF